MMIPEAMRNRLRPNTMRLLNKIFESLRPPKRISTREWADTYRYFGEEEGATKGKYEVSKIPYLTWPNSPLDALDDPKVYEVVGQKSAQVAWTTGVMGNYIGSRISFNPATILGLFPKDEASVQWVREKFEPMIRATPILSEKIKLNSRKENSTMQFKKFPGGFIKVAGSNSPSSVKSAPIAIIFIEEPDDCNMNLRSQGDSITLAKERVKSFNLNQIKFIIGGTPTVKGISTVEREMQLSDQRYGMVPCNECGEFNPLSFEHFFIPEIEGLSHPIFGNKSPDDAYYTCPSCGATWDFYQKNKNLKDDRCHWLATAKFNGIAGFYINELYSVFEGANFKTLAEKKLIALHEYNMGKPEKLIAYINSSEGMPYEYVGDTATADDLKEHGLDYDLGTVPDGGLILTAGVDVQEDRLEMIVRAWGRDDQSWLVDRQKFYGNISDAKSPVWNELSTALDHQYECANGRFVMIERMSIDSGYLSENVYKFVRAHKRTLAIKGSSTDFGTREIFAVPRKIDTRHKVKRTKSDKYGVQSYQVGTQRAKTQISDWLSLSGRPTAVFFWPQSTDDVNLDDYLTELTNEVYAPDRSGRMLWQVKSGARVEALDCEVYALHAARSLNIHRKTHAEWQRLESMHRQVDLFTAPDVPVEAPIPAPSPIVRQKRSGKTMT